MTKKVKTKKINTQPYKGVRDFYPQDWRFQKWLFWQMAEVCEKFGYENYTASPLEYTELFAAKSGKEIVENQIYNFKDRGKRDVSLRPEMTPTLARMIAAKNVEIPRPIRWYSIPNLFRYEKPQKGRLREHYQLNVDIFGVEGIEADIEVIKIGAKIMKNLGATNNDYVIKVNNRKITDSILTIISLFDDSKKYDLSKLLDKKNKITDKEFESGAFEIFDNKDLYELFLDFTKLYEKGLDIENITAFKEHQEKYLNEWFDCFTELKDTRLIGKLQKNKMILLENINNGYDKIQELITGLQKIGLTNIIFDLTLMRGLDYYTDIVFEFFDTHPENNRSMFGGGRYDDLLDIFGGEKIPAVGFGMGDVTAKNFLEVRDNLPDLKSKTDIAVLPLSSEFKATADKIANDLRQDGKNIEVDYTYRKIDKQIKSAERKKISQVIIVGENEAKSGEYKIKSL